MPSSLSDVDQVFADLESAFQELQESRASPRDVRRKLALFTMLTQQLTEAIRREFSACKGVSWEASAFPGWTPVTDLFKSMRNMDLHGNPIQIVVEETLVGRTDLGALLQFRGTWELHDQQAGDSPMGLTLVRSDPKTGSPSADALPIVSRTFAFHIHPRTSDLERQLRNAGSRDLHDLSAACIEVLRDYYGFYRAKLDGR